VQYGTCNKGFTHSNATRLSVDVKLVVNGTSPDPLYPTLKAEHPDDFITVHCPNTGPTLACLTVPIRPIEFVRASA
jgi:hypothetical protein